MAAVTFRRAVRENVPLIIGLIGGTGSGKTWSAMELATGLAGDKRFAVIDTEAGRAKHYADHFAFDHADLSPPFRPQTYIDAIDAADKAGYPVVMVDSMSHVWAGDGGVLDWQEEELQRMAGDDARKRDNCKVAAWIKPKMGHKAMVQKFLQMRCHLVLCFRAEPKIDMVRNEKTGKMEIVPKVSKTGRGGWIPVCEKNLPFELTMSFLLTDDAPGLPLPIKIEHDHLPMVPLDKPFTRGTGVLLARWAAGADASRIGIGKVLADANSIAMTGMPASAAAQLGPPQLEDDPYIAPEQVIQLEAKCNERQVPLARLCAVAQVSGLRFIQRTDFQRALQWLERHPSAVDANASAGAPPGQT